MNEYYTADKKQLEEDNDNVYAKKEWNGKAYIYYIRRAVSGPDVPHLLNPWGMYFENGVNNRRFESHLGKRQYEYRKVPENVFNLYLDFLASRNQRFLREAERSLD